MVIVALLIGLVAGAAGVYAVGLRRALADRDRATIEAREAQRALAETEGALAAERGAFDVRVETAIKALSTEALRANATAFTEQAMGRLGVFVEPLQKSLDKVELNVGLLEQQRQRAYGEIHKELELSRLTNEGLRRQTGSLASALKGESHTRGRWGEIQLRRVIEMAGMLPHCDFDEQRTIPGEDGGILRPDVIVKLPGDKSIVIDAKVSLSGYLRAHEEGADDEARLAGMADHARQVRDHVQRLSQKAYWRQLPETPDFVVMFMHDESSLARAALAVDKDAVRARACEPCRPLQRRRPSSAVFACHALRVAAGANCRKRARDQRPRPRALQAALDDGRTRVEARAGRSTARSSPTTRRSARWNGRCCRRRGASSSTGSPASSRPSSCRSTARRGR